MISLTGKQKRFLRGLGHHLRPVVYVGQNGLSEQLIQHATAELEAHELIKVKVGENSPEGARDLAADLAQATDSALAQILGHTILLYRPRAEEPEIVLPR